MKFSRFLSSPASLVFVAVAVMTPPGEALGQAFGGGGLGPSDFDPSKTFTFPGGTVKEYVEQVKEHTPEELQVHIRPEIEDVPIEPVRLTGAGSHTLLDLLDDRFVGQGRVQVQSHFLPEANTSYWRITPPPFQTRVFSVRQFIGFNEMLSGISQEESIKALISVIEAALALSSNTAPEVKIKIHPDTGLLLVSGTRQQVEIVEQVVSQLHGAPMAAKAEATEDSAEGLQAQIERLERELRGLRAQLAEKQGGHDASQTEQP